MSQSERKGDKPSIICMPNGPLMARNLPSLEGVEGKPLETKKAVALCRCGRSNSMPFCDGSHKKAGFSDARETDGALDKRVDYRGKAVTLHDNRGICSHAGHCTRELPTVFKMGEEPWIDPDAEPPESIIETVKKCPSGALSYSVGGREERDRDRPPGVTVLRNGPYAIGGGVELKDVAKGEGASDEHYVLCRCGHSKNKPFCDGSHWYAGFRDDNLVRVAVPGDLQEGLNAVQAEGVDLLLVKRGENVAAFSGRCLHQRALLAEGELEEGVITCGLHGWRYDADTGELDGSPGRGLTKLAVTVEEWDVLVDRDELSALREPEGSPPPKALNVEDEPTIEAIHELAEHGLREAHGSAAAMGVLRRDLPQWDDLQILTAQLHRFPLLDDEPVGTDLVIGPGARKPLELEIPLFVTDMSYGALSFEAKVALAKGAELAGTGICSGEGGMLPEEQAANSRYLYELASGRFGFSMEKLTRVQAFHFKGGQGAKSGVGGHLPGEKVTEKIAAVRGLTPGQAAISPSRFDYESLEDFKAMAEEVREAGGGIPVGFKLSAQHIEKDLEAALSVGVDYVILDGRGGGTGAAPLIIRDHISVPTLAALPRARLFLDEAGASHVTLIATGGLRTAPDFVKALALGADGVAVGNAAIQAMGCMGARICHTNRCPAGIATQDEALRKTFDAAGAPERLARFLRASVDLMRVLARACGHRHLNRFRKEDLTTWKREIAYLTGVSYAGFTPLGRE